ncbi:methyltransferase-like protein 27 [Synchiropus splendidus]|uniref:methyltransferase-like protein 27 n=1 Tax=Synchiropus splendidus TaxID=270530 RepID=UPI00237E0507|nr:methyltransferase-like protein 27 [Synchiropus splendidus]
MAMSAEEIMAAKEKARASRGCDPEQLVNFYDSWAETYEKNVDSLNYQGPKLVAELISSHFSGNPAEARVLDVACGPGQFAALMKERGFRMFSGVDYSEKMLKEAEKTGDYQSLEQAHLGTDPLPGDADSFDVVVLIGALNKHLVPFSVLRELCKVTKPGGLICLTKTNYKNDDAVQLLALEKELKQMEDEGLWTKVTVTKCDKYLRNAFVENMLDDEFLCGYVWLFQK